MNHLDQAREIVDALAQFLDAAEKLQHVEERYGFKYFDEDFELRLEALRAEVAKEAT